MHSHLANWPLHRVAVAALLLLGSFLRLAALEQYPLGVHQDELSNIYDGHALAETGADRFGSRYPLVVRAFGENDYRPALYPWLAAIPQSVVGFSVAAGRLPAALLGIASLWLVYLFARRTGGERFAVFTLLFAVLSPWHLQYSRVAHEGAILPAFFAILFLYLWHRSASSGFTTPSSWLLGFCIGLSTSAYQATRLTAVLFAIAVGIEIVRTVPKPVSRLIAFGAWAAAGALPQLVVMVSDPAHFFARARTLTNTMDGPLGFAGGLIRNYALNLEPRYLFLPRIVEDLTVARLLPIELIFFTAGIGALLLRRQLLGRWRVHVLLALVICLLPAALTEGNPNTLRSSGLATLTPLVSAAGVLLIGQLAARTNLPPRMYYAAALISVVATSLVVTYRYTRSHYFRSVTFQPELVRLGTVLRTYEPRFDRIDVERYGGELHLYLAAFGGITPREFQAGPKDYYSVGMDIFRSVGKYHIVQEPDMKARIEQILRENARTLVVTPRREPGLHVIDSVGTGGERFYLMVPKDSISAGVEP